jgi:phenylpyruvate tautomerase PptA (4-oxalocrotonate tautomerase family)
MMGVGGINIDKIDIGTIFSGIGQLAKDIRQAITGEITPEKKAEIAAKVTEMENTLQNGTISVALAEAQSADKWTSRSRPMFMYVIYIMLIFSIPYGFMCLFSPVKAQVVATGFKAWLEAIPDNLYWLFGAGYLGYGAFRSFDKFKGVK